MAIDTQEAEIKQITKHIELRVPRLIPQLRREDKLVLKQWFVAEGEIIAPGQHMVLIQTPPYDVDVYAPYSLKVPHRVVSLAVVEGDELVRMGDLFIILEPVMEEYR
jgi:hypothetical protein